MKTIYLQKSNIPTSSRKKLLYRSIILFLIIVAFSYSSWLRSSVSTGLQAVGVPMWRIENYVYNSQFGVFAYFRSKGTLERENKSLRERNQQLESEVMKTNILQDENETLKNERGRSNNRDKILATVIVRPSKSFYDTAIIDIGSDHGVTAGSYVAIHDVYLGKIQEVYEHTSKVIFFSSSGEYTDVLLNPSHISVVAYGLGGGNFQAQVAKGVDVNIGDVVTIPSIGVDIFATVEDIIEKPTDSFRTILFKNPINIETIKWLEVVRQ